MKYKQPYTDRYNYEYFRGVNRQYELTFPVCDIPNHPFLFIREGAFVFQTNKETGEISKQLSLPEYADVWRNEWENNPYFRSYYTKGYFIPKESPDTARNIPELKKLCSDNTRHIKGTDAYFLDFILSDQVNTTQSKMFAWMCKHVVVWNYSIFSMEHLFKSTPLTKKQTKAVFAELQDKKLIKVVTDRFEGNVAWSLLVKLHPKLHWKGRYSAWAAHLKLEYEYEQPMEMD